jgi:DNA ligase-1
MLADTLPTLGLLRYADGQWLVSPKIDGIRLTIQGGKALTRSLKLIPNEAVHAFLKRFPALEGLDGELMVNGVKLQTVASVFMSRSTKLPAQWYFGVFDALPKYTGEPFSSRYARAVAAVASVAAQTGAHVVIVPQLQVRSSEDVIKFEESALKMGFEGVVIRRAESPYKHGRSSLSEGALLKFKRFQDGEAEIVGFKVSKVSKDALGSFLCRDLTTNVVFEVGIGLTLKQRSDFWRDRETLLGSIIKYKSYPARKGKPGSSVFLAFRSPEDM